MTRHKKEILSWALSVGLFAISLAFLGYRRITVYDNSLNKTVMVAVPVRMTEYVFGKTNGKLTLEKKEVIGAVRGSGAFITKNGHILTCAHLFTVGHILSINVTTYDGKNAPARLLAFDAGRDLALLTTNLRGTPYFRLSRNPRVGDTVFAVGNPLAVPFSVSQGIISAIHRQTPMEDMVQTDTAINPGNSGGPLVGMDGKLVGINSQILPPVDAPIFTGLGFAISADEIRAFLSRFNGLGGIN